MRYNIEKWHSKTWQTESRFYTAKVEQNLFGEWYCYCSWGSRITRHGHSKIFLALNYDDAINTLQKTEKRRLQRGYVLTSTGSR